MNELPVTYRGAVYPWHCDHNGHMNVMWYTGKFDEATWHFLASIGLTPQFLRAENRLMAAVEQRTTYRRELRAGDIVTVRSGLIEMGEKSIRFFHEMRCEETGALAAVTELIGVCVDASTRRAVAFPAQTRERAAAAAPAHASPLAG